MTLQATAGLAQLEAWGELLHQAARQFGVEVPADTLEGALKWSRDLPLAESLAGAARSAGLQLREIRLEAGLAKWRLPALLELREGGAVLVLRREGDGALCSYSGSAGMQTEATLAALEQACTGRAFLVQPAARLSDERVDPFTRAYRKDWLWSALAHYWPRYSEVFIASLLANVLALSTVVFSMQVYDRVVPAQSETTLWVLFGGVCIALVAEFLLKLARAHIADLVGKKVDLEISSMFFGRALRIRNEARPRSTGSFISQLRELEQVRELLTSVTVVAFTDLPFVLLFLAVIWYLGGVVAWVVAASVVALIVPGILFQPYLARLSRTGMREAAVRSAVLMEAVEGVEDIKSLRAEARFQRQWDACSEVSARVGMRQRLAGAMLVGWNQEVQSLAFALVLVVGAYQVFKGDMSTGALVGSSILASRALAPLAMLATIFVRWQQAKVAREGLDAILKLPTDRPADGAMLHRPVLNGHYQLRDLAFRYNPEQAGAPALEIPRLEIRPGERVGVIGRVGAGKSTLLQLLAGMQRPQAGSVLLDGTGLNDIEVHDVRRDVGLLTQWARLFHGTLRENLLIGAPDASEEQILSALRTSGALALVQGHPRGLDATITEGGQGLSGGQRQALLLARTLVRQPRIVLLDEPTAALDDGSELQFVQAFNAWSAGRTVVMATHRAALLACVDRIVVLEAGRIQLDGPKQLVLERLGTAGAKLAAAA